MAYIDKLLNKFNKVKNAVNSIKGIQSKIQSINYTTAIDALGIEKGAAEELINSRRNSLEKQLSSSGMARGCLLYTSPSPRDGLLSRMPSSA